MKRTQFSILAMVALLFGVADGAVLHQHGFAVGEISAACVGTHSAKAPPAPGTSELAGAGKEHHHECLGCHLSRLRFSAPSSSPEVSALTEVSRVSLAEIADESSPDLRIGAARGPPTT